MKIRSQALALSFAATACIAPFATCSAAAEPASSEKEAESQKYKEIHTEELKRLIDAKKPMVILDARNKITVGVLPGAKHLSYDADETFVKQALGSHPKDYMIVVYCARAACPLSKYLAENLISQGYTNVYKYPEGIEEWMKSYPIDRVKS